MMGFAANWRESRSRPGAGDFRRAAQRNEVTWTRSAVQKVPAIPRGRRPRRGCTTRRHEHDACGLGFVAHIKGRKSHAIVTQGLVDPREPDAPRRDGRRSAAGRRRRHPAPASRRVLPPRLRQARHHAARRSASTAWAWCSCRRSPRRAMACEQEIERAIHAEGQVLLGWRDVPIEQRGTRRRARKEVEPVIRQVFVGRGARDTGPGRASSASST